MSARRIRLAAAALATALSSIAADAAGQAASPAISAYDALHPLALPAGAAGLVAADLPPMVLARVRTADAADLRVFDANGAPQPHALVRPRPAQAQSLAVLDVLPIRGASASVGGLRLRIDQSDGRRVVEAFADGAPDVRPDAPPRAWLLDTRTLAAPLAELEIDATLPPGRIVGATLHASADLRDWTPIATASALYRADAGDGQPRTERIALRAPEALRGRWLRIALDDGTLVAARAVIRPPAAPGEGAVWLPLGSASDKAGEAAREWRVPFGLPIEALALQPGRPDALAQLRVLGRDRLGEPWRLLGEGIAYRITRPGQDEAVSPPLPLRSGTAALLRIESETPGFATLTFEPRAAVAPLRIVFVAGGAPPYRLAVGLDPTGAPRAAALPIASLMPGWREGAELALPRATIGDAPARGPRASVMEIGGVRIEARSVLLWAVLLGGVAALAWVARVAARAPQSPDSSASSRERSASDRSERS